MIAEKLTAQKLLDLCSIVYSHNLHKDYTRFFLAFVPEKAADW